MTDELTKTFDGDGHEIIGLVRVLKIMHDDDADRPFHLEIDADDAVLDQLVKFGSESTSYVDFLSSGIRSGIIERIAREREK